MILDSFNELNIYKEYFSNLNSKITNGIKMPNKAIMLLSVIDLIRCGFIKSNEIYINETIEEAFNFTWKRYYSTQAPTPWTPFWHLKKEPFWHFCPINSLEEVHSLAAPGETASVAKMRSAIKYAFLDSKLFHLLKNTQDRNILMSVLLDKYILIE